MNVSRNEASRLDSPQLYDDREAVKDQQKIEIKKLLGEKRGYGDPDLNNSRVKPVDEFEELLEETLDFENMGGKSAMGRSVKPGTESTL